MVMQGKISREEVAKICVAALDSPRTWTISSWKGIDQEREREQIDQALLKNAKECLKREKDRVSHYLHSSSGTTLLFIIFLASLTLGTILMAFLKKMDGEEIE
ncbi:hypothetical protein Tco_0332106 [Tanacetum coccineum]